MSFAKCVLRYVTLPPVRIFGACVLRRDIIRDLHASKPSMQPGDVLYVLDAQWWSLWKETVGYEGTASGSKSNSASKLNKYKDSEGADKKVSDIGPIDNSRLLQREGKDNAFLSSRLRPNLIKDTDYVFLSAQYVWKPSCELVNSADTACLL